MKSQISIKIDVDSGSATFLGTDKEGRYILSANNKGIIQEILAKANMDSEQRLSAIQGEAGWASLVFEVQGDAAFFIKQMGMWVA